DFAIYTAVRPAVPIDELVAGERAPLSGRGEGQAPPSRKAGGRRRAASQPASQASVDGPVDIYALTAEQDLSKPDQVNDHEFNLVLWHAAKGLDTPYPAEFAGAHGRGLQALGLKADLTGRKSVDDDDDD